MFYLLFGQINVPCKAKVTLNILSVPVGLRPAINAKILAPNAQATGPPMGILFHNQKRTVSK